MAPWQGIAVLAGLALLVTTVIGFGYLLRPPTADLLGPLPPDPAVTCDSERLDDGPLFVRSGTLVTCPSLFQDREVMLEGELIGDLLGRGEGRWVLLNDDAFAYAGPLGSHRVTFGANSGMAVLLPAGVEPQVLGGPGVWGDLVQIEGTFDVAASQDQGGTTVIATTLRTVRPGGPVDTPSVPTQRITAGALVLLATVLSAIAWRRRSH